MTETEKGNQIYGQIVVRKAREDDADSIVKIHHDAVHKTASQSYEENILNEWAPSLTSQRLKNHRMEFIENKDDAIFVVAEINGEVVGFGMFVPKTKELSAVYVSSRAERKNVGAKILSALENIARDLKIQSIWLKASLNAEKFYLRHGFIHDGEGEHIFKSGLKMPCVNMHKNL